VHELDAEATILPQVGMGMRCDGMAAGGRNRNVASLPTRSMTAQIPRHAMRMGNRSLLVG